MRRHFFIIIAALAVSCAVISCGDVVAEEGGVDLAKPPIVLQLTVTNSMDAPIDVQMWHRYTKDTHGGVTTAPDPAEYTIPAGGGEMLGNETAAFMKDGEETEWSGFVLLDDELVSSFGGRNGYSSFELRGYGYTTGRV